VRGFQNFPGDAHEAFIELVPQRLLLGAIRVAPHLDSAKERLDIAREGAVLRPQLEYTESSPAATSIPPYARTRSFMPAMSTRSICAVRSMSALPVWGLHGGRDAGLAAAHEAASDAGDGRPLARLIAQMLEREVGVRENDPVRGLAAWFTKPKELLTTSSCSIRSSTLGWFATCFRRLGRSAAHVPFPLLPYALNECSQSPRPGRGRDRASDA